MKRILLVEDEKNFARVLSDYLRMNSFDVTLCEDGEIAGREFSVSKFDLCILDIMMPKKDGFTLGAEIRSADRRVPMIYLTARAMRQDMIKGYQLGADDYIIKPFDSEVLLMKIKAILGRAGNDGVETYLYKVGTFSFNARLRSLTPEKGTLYKLSPKESALLSLLCRHMNDVLPRDKALNEIWKKDNYFTGRSMDVFIAKLRKYLESDAGIRIENIHGNGYSLRC